MRHCIFVQRDNENETGQIPEDKTDKVRYFGCQCSEPSLEETLCISTCHGEWGTCHCIPRLSSVLRSKLTVVCPILTKYVCVGVADGLPLTLPLVTLHSFLQIHVREL